MMALILDLPDIGGWQSLNFDPILPMATDRMESGRRSETLYGATSWWTAAYRAPLIDNRQLGRLESFMMQIGSGAFFRAYDASRPRPMAMDTGQPLSGLRAGGGAFNGTATLSAILSPLSIRLSGLPANFQFWESDYVEVRQSASVLSLHRVTADVQASGAGIATLPIAYALDTGTFTTAAVVNLEKPACLMALKPGSWDGKKTRLQRSPSFSAEEVFP